MFVKYDFAVRAAAWLLQNFESQLAHLKDPWTFLQTLSVLSQKKKKVSKAIENVVLYS